MGKVYVLGRMIDDYLGCKSCLLLRRLIYVLFVEGNGSQLHYPTEHIY